jgi:hypothetical protein
MTDEQPRPKPGYAAQIWWFTLGLLIFGVIGYAAMGAYAAMVAGAYGAAANEGTVGIITLAIIMILLTGGAAICAMLLRKIALGSGLLVGYAVATVGSGGQCTYLAAPANYGFLGGGFIYLISLVLAVFVGVIALIGRRGTS